MNWRVKELLRDFKYHIDHNKEFVNADSFFYFLISNGYNEKTHYFQFYFSSAFEFIAAS